MEEETTTAAVATTTTCTAIEEKDLKFSHLERGHLGDDTKVECVG